MQKVFCEACVYVYGKSLQNKKPNMCVWYLSCLSSASRVGFCWTLSGVGRHACSCSARKRWISCKISLKTHTALPFTHSLRLKTKTTGCKSSWKHLHMQLWAWVPVLVLQLHDQFSLLFVGVVAEVRRTLGFTRAAGIKKYDWVHLLSCPKMRAKCFFDDKLNVKNH